MKITSFATLAALVFTFNLSANPFALEEVLPDDGDVAFSLPLKLKTEKAIQDTLRSGGYPVEKTQVSFITVHNTTKQPVEFGGFKIPGGKKSLFSRTFDRHEHFEDVPLKSVSPLLLSILPSAFIPQPKLSPLPSWTIMGDALITFVSAEDWYNQRISEKHGLIYKEYPHVVVMPEVACDPNEWFARIYAANKGAIFIDSRSDVELAHHRLQPEQDKQK